MSYRITERKSGQLLLVVGEQELAHDVATKMAALTRKVIVVRDNDSGAEWIADGYDSNSLSEVYEREVYACTQMTAEIKAQLENMRNLSEHVVYQDLALVLATGYHLRRALGLYVGER